MPISDTDKDFWLETVRDVIKSKQNNAVLPINRKTKPKIVRHEQYAIKQEFSTYSKFLDDFGNGGIDNATLRKFKKEEFKIDAVLDLHGCKEDEAYRKVSDFVVKSYNRGLRCVIIVTGKGLRTYDDDDIFAAHGVLRQQVPQWLEQPNMRAMILIYKHPSERLGGEGALYILLRRNKEF